MLPPPRRSPSEEQNNPTDRRIAAVAGRLVSALQRLQNEHADLTVRQAMCLLIVAQQPGITLRKLYDRLGYEHASLASRQVSLLASIGSRYRESGLQLVRVEEDPNDRRQRLLHLTPKGRRIMADILRLIDGAAGSELH